MRMQDEASGNSVGGISEHGVQQPQGTVTRARTDPRGGSSVLNLCLYL